MPRRKRRLATDPDLAELGNRPRSDRKHQPRGRLAVIDDDVLRADIGGSEPLLAERDLQRSPRGDHLFRDHRIARLDRKRRAQRAGIAASLGQPGKFDRLESEARTRHRA